MQYDKRIFDCSGREGSKRRVRSCNTTNECLIARPDPVYGQDEKEGLYYMEPDDRDGKERLRYLLHIGGMLDCGEYGSSEKEARVQVLKRLYEEAKGLVDGRESERLLETFVYEASEVLSRPIGPELSFDERNETIERAADRYLP
ncbi:hypothetical protein [Thiohalobacter thiocyanaticus]|uniref:hypothetical protein n=1 Tax=Thiohalobacter thiocyanaticus TaxID=585455 RepID=UPI000F64154F|nr:hypothetical protein [Thiohalobacter thiocyanaticus]